MLPIPDDFAHTITTVFESGAEWLERLPDLVAEFEERWSLKVGPPFLLSYNYVAPAARADGTEVVFKAGVPDDERRAEIYALRHYNGRGCVRMLEADEARCVFLLERLHPGTMLVTETDDEKATFIAAGVMQNLWRPAPAQHAFPTVEDWAAGLNELRPRFDGGTGPLSARLVEQAKGLFAELLPSQAERVLLHGDLHHFNILSAEREPWLAIDPHGVIGEPAYEVGAWMRNPLPQILQVPNPVEVLSRRIDIFAEVWNLDRARLRGWTIAQAVLSAWWDVEDSGTMLSKDFLALMELLAEIPE